MAVARGFSKEREGLKGYATGVNIDNIEPPKEKLKSERESEVKEEKSIKLFIRTTPKVRQALKHVVAQEGLSYGEFIEKILLEQYPQYYSKED